MVVASSSERSRESTPQRKAGVALVLPVLMQMTSNDVLGGDVASSAVARSMGAGRQADANANALVWHSVVVAVVFCAVFTVAMIGGAFAGTILTLAFLPAMYAIWFKIRYEQEPVSS